MDELLSKVGMQRIDPDLVDLSDEESDVDSDIDEDLIKFITENQATRDAFAESK